MIKKTLPFLLCVFALMQSCIQKGDAGEMSPAFEKEFSLNFFYSNPTGTDPVISLDRTNSSSEVLIDGERDIDFDQVGNFLLDIHFKNIQVFSEGAHYEIVQVETQTLLNDDWEKDIDFKTRFQSVPDMDVVLALDVSESVGEDFPDLQQQAKEFISNLKQEAPGVRVGVVSFGTNVEKQEIDTNHELSLQFIDGMVLSQFTKLYEGIYTGAHMLNNSMGMNRKVLITFTDGRDNFSDTSYTPIRIKDVLQSEDPEGVGIQHNIVGYESKASVDRNVLQSLAINGSVKFPNSIDQLGDAFNSFSNSVGTTYQVVYQRNTKIIQENEVLRFLIKVKRKEER